jgi:glycosyltransferase involved in cell wall biosynthesis
MHGYFGTCVSGLKMHAFPCVTACERPYGTGCLAYYLPRRCGCLSPGTLLTGWRWSEAQRSLFERYAAILVASEHMRREYVRSGVPIERVSVNPLFAGRPAEASAAPVPPSHRVAFLGRMTPAKGGDLLIRAVRYASQRLNLPIHLTMIGDGPERTNWTALATRLGVETLFTGWVAGDERWPFIRDASLIAVPSLWPEPFGMAGLEAGAVGVAAIALDSGGISEWLRDGVNGMLVRTPSAEAFGSALASLLADRPRLASLRDGALRIAREMSLARHVDRLEALCQTVHGADRRAVPVPCGSC